MSNQYSELPPMTDAEVDDFLARYAINPTNPTPNHNYNFNFDYDTTASDTGSVAWPSYPQPNISAYGTYGDHMPQTTLAPVPSTVHSSPMNFWLNDTSSTHTPTSRLRLTEPAYGSMPLESQPSMYDSPQQFPTMAQQPASYYNAGHNPAVSASVPASAIPGSSQVQGSSQKEYKPMSTIALEYKPLKAALQTQEESGVLYEKRKAGSRSFWQWSFDPNTQCRSRRGEWKTISLNPVYKSWYPGNVTPTADIRWSSNMQTTPKSTAITIKPTTTSPNSLPGEICRKMTGSTVLHRYTEFPPQPQVVCTHIEQGEVNGKLVNIKMDLTLDIHCPSLGITNPNYGS